MKFNKDDIINFDYESNSSIFKILECDEKNKEYFLELLYSKKVIAIKGYFWFGEAGAMGWLSANTIDYNSQINGSYKLKKIIEVL